MCHPRSAHLARPSGHKATAAAAPREGADCKGETPVLCTAQAPRLRLSLPGRRWEGSGDTL